MCWKPSPRLPMSSAGARSKSSAAVTDAVMPELLLDAIDGRRCACAPRRAVVVGRTRNIDRPARPAKRIVRVLGLLGARDHEVVLAVAGGDEDLLAGDEPVAVRVLLAARAQPRHVASRRRAR